MARVSIAIEGYLVEDIVIVAPHKGAFMFANSCCDTSRHQVDDGKGVGTFNETERRNPIGKVITRYTCVECGHKWKRTAPDLKHAEGLWHHDE